MSAKTVKDYKAEIKAMEQENEFFRQQCIAEEIRARFHKAVHDKMYYYIQWNTLIDPYNSLLEANSVKESPVIPEGAVLNEGAEELQEVLEEIKSETPVVQMN